MYDPSTMYDPSIMQDQQHYVEATNSIVVGGRYTTTHKEEGERRRQRIREERVSETTSPWPERPSSLPSPPRRMCAPLGLPAPGSRLTGSVARCGLITLRLATSGAPP